MLVSTALEVTGAALGLLGALLLATQSRHAPWAWLLWLASNACWAAFAVLGSYWFLLAQQVGFSLTSAIGLWVWLLRPALAARQQRRGL